MVKRRYKNGFFIDKSKKNDRLNGVAILKRYFKKTK